MANIDQFSPRSGRSLREDGEYINTADIYDDVTSEFGEYKTITRSPVISLNGALPFSDFRDERNTENTGTVTDTGPEYRLRHSTAGDFASLRTTRRGIYIPGSSAQIGIGVRTSSNTISGDGVARWGYFDVDSQDEKVIETGIFYGLDAEGFFVEVVKDGTSREKTYSTNFNVNNEDIDLTNGNIFQIDYTYYGYGLIKFQVQEGEAGDTRQSIKTLHTMKFHGSPSVDRTNLKVGALVSSTTGTGQFDIFVGGRQYSVVGPFRPLGRLTSARSLSDSIDDTFSPVLSFRKKTDFKQIGVELFGFTAIATEDSILQVRYNPTLTGASFGIISETPSTETALEVDTSATAVDTSTGIKLYETFISGGGGPDPTDLSQALDIPLDLPDEGIITFAARTLTGSGTINIIGQMEERW